MSSAQRSAEIRIIPGLNRAQSLMAIMLVERPTDAPITLHNLEENFRSAMPRHTHAPLNSDQERAVEVAHHYTFELTKDFLVGNGLAREARPFLRKVILPTRKLEDMYREAGLFPPVPNEK